VRTVSIFKNNYKAHRVGQAAPAYMEMRVELKMEVLRVSGCRYFLRGPNGAIGSSSTS
jgi:hypothetical protein